MHGLHLIISRVEQRLKVSNSTVLYSVVSVPSLSAGNLSPFPHEDCCKQPSAVALMPGAPWRPRHAENQQQGNTFKAIAFLSRFEETGGKEMLKVIPTVNLIPLLSLLSAKIPSLQTFTLCTP